jgi:hypothetical protein
MKLILKQKNLDICNALMSPSLQSQIQLQIYSNHTEEKIRLRTSSISSKTSNQNKSLIKLTIDSCSGNFYTTQDIKTLNIIPDFLKPIRCTKFS